MDFIWVFAKFICTVLTLQLGALLIIHVFGNEVLKTAKCEMKSSQMRNEK